MGNDLAEAVLSRKEVPPGEKRRGFGADVCPDQAAQLLHMAGPDSEVLLHVAVGGLQRGFQDAARGVVEPAVVGAPQPGLLRDAELQIHCPMYASIGDEARLTLPVSEQDQVLAEDSDLL